MTGRERMLAALSPAGTTEFPVWICYEGIYVRDHWDALTSWPWWFTRVPDLARQMAWRRDVAAAVPHDVFLLSLCPARSVRETFRIEDRADGVFRVDQRTGVEERLERPHIGGWSGAPVPESARVLELPTTFDDVDALIPAVDDGEPHFLDGEDDLANLMLDEFGSDRYPIYHVSSPMWRIYGLWGFEGMMTLVATRPDLVEHAAARFLASAGHEVRVAAALGVAGIWVEECMTDMIGPDAFSQLNLPSLRRLIDEIRALGMASVYYYCGNPAGKWDVILEAGADVIAFEEGKKGFNLDIDDVVARVNGRCTVLGNLDAVGVLQDGSDEALRWELARQVAAGRRNGGRFIAGLGSPVTPGTPVSRVQTFCALAHKA